MITQTTITIIINPIKFQILILIIIIIKIALTQTITVTKTHPPPTTDKYPPQFPLGRIQPKPNAQDLERKKIPK
jgi:hypothetical protein